MDGQGPSQAELESPKVDIPNKKSAEFKKYLLNFKTKIGRRIRRPNVQPQISTESGDYQTQISVEDQKILYQDDPKMVERNKYRQRKGELKPLVYPDLTFVGTIHSRGLNDPEVKACINEVTKYATDTSDKKKVVIIEGYQSEIPQFHSLDEAAKVGEMQAVAQIARENGLEVKSLEIPLKDAAQKLEEKGISRKDFAIYLTLLAIPGAVRENGTVDINNLSGLQSYLSAEFGFTHDNSWLEKLNQKMIELTSKPLITADGRLNSDLAGQNPKSFINNLVLTRGTNATLLFRDISKQYNFLRDSYIFNQTQELVKNGYKPLEFYGSDHSNALKDAFDNSFKPPEQLQQAA